MRINLNPMKCSCYLWCSC